MSFDISPKLGWKAAMRSMFTRLINNPTVQKISEKFLHTVETGDFRLGMGLLGLSIGALGRDPFFLGYGSYCAMLGFKQSRNYAMSHKRGRHLHFHVHAHPHPV